MEQIRSADVLANFPQVDEEKLNAALAAEAAASNRKIIVLDDDPTGVQTVHDIYVYTDWTVESLRKGFAAPEKLFFILTNSRGFTVAETTKAHREIAENTAKVAREFGMDYLIISRGDSTLRVKCAKVLGQIRPGIPVWQTGAESLFPGTPYIIFPGNVGEVPTLREAVEILLG